MARFDFLEFDVMVKKNKLKYQPIWDAVRSAYPDWTHNKVDELAGKMFGQVKFDRVQYQEKLAELQEKAAKRKRKSLLFWKKPAARRAKTEKNCPIAAKGVIFVRKIITFTQLLLPLPIYFTNFR